MQETLEELPSTPRRPPPGHAPANAIGVRGATFSYGEKRVIDDLSIDFAEGKTTVLVGPVGAGKSTLFKILLGFVVPERGDAYLFGKWYRDLDISEVRRSVGYVPQNPVLFNDTVLYNLTYGNGATREDAERAMKFVGYDSSFLDRKVGKNGMHLSGGQRQLVWCLRVLFKNPPVLLMDEPTASMDEETKGALMSVLNKMMRDRTVIMITHDSYLVRRADVLQRLG